ncbi:MAG: hypothetical protein EOR94_20770 [Mesorhizobium sp.]|nr:MAG: hypothetical protein EOR94_20770 [Mesorhizobium sp.]
MATNQSPFRQLDPTPTFEEEVRDFQDFGAYSGFEPFDGEAAKTRIDKIARRLAITWSAFLIYIILAQGFETGWSVWLLVKANDWRQVYLIRPFHLGTTEFVAVVTTTTASVFGFLIIVANHLFHRKKQESA